MTEENGSQHFSAVVGTQQAVQEEPKQGLSPDISISTEPAQAEGRADMARVKLTLALSAEDKCKLKTAAAKRGVTVAKLVHEWIKTLN